MKLGDSFARMRQSGVHKRGVRVARMPATPYVPYVLEFALENNDHADCANNRLI